MANANKVQFPFDQGITYWQSSPEVKNITVTKDFVNHRLIYSLYTQCQTVHCSHFILEV